MGVFFAIMVIYFLFQLNRRGNNGCDSNALVLTSGELDTLRQETPWRLMQLLGAKVVVWIGYHDDPDPALAVDVIRAMSERPRKRRLQSLPDKVKALVKDCRSMGHVRCDGF